MQNYQIISSSSEVRDWLDEAPTAGANALALGVHFLLIRGILALNLLALRFILFSPLCFSSLQMWLRKPLPWQSTQRNLLLWVILRWTATCWGDSSYAHTHTHTHTHLLDYSWLSPSLSSSFSLSLTASLSLSFSRPLFRSGQMEHFSTLAPGALVRWQNDLSWKCQVHQKEWVMELIKETDE